MDFYYNAFGSLFFNGFSSYSSFYVYKANGNICLSSLTSFSKKICIKTKFKERDIVYIKDKANKGVLESIAIKRIQLTANRCTGNQFVTLYEDFYNSLWNENQIINKQEAIDLAKIYLNRQIALTEQTIKTLNPHSCYSF